MPKKLEAFDARCTFAARALAIIGLIGLVILAGMTITDVLMRWLFNSPIDGVADIGRLIVAVIIASFFPVALAEKHHISIDFLGKILSPRLSLWLEVVAALVTIVFFVVLSWQFAVFSLELHESGETTWLLALPVAPWWSAATLFLMVSVPVQTMVFLGKLAHALNYSPVVDDTSEASQQG